jgi:hypothetical protein
MTAVKTCLSTGNETWICQANVTRKQNIASGGSESPRQKKGLMSKFKSQERADMFSMSQTNLYYESVAPRYSTEYEYFTINF